jgi:hypothetical protein
MVHAQLTASVRALVLQTFAQFSLPVGDELQETILIRGGAYCGRRFDAEQGHAIWFIEEGQLKFFDANGSVIHMIEPIAAHSAGRQAA